MKNTALFLVLFFLALFFDTFLPGPSAHAGEPAFLERPAQVLIQDDLLILWRLGLSAGSTQNQQNKFSQMDLSRNALMFLMLSDEVNSVLYREGNTALFRRVPEAYSGYVKKELVEEVAARVFGQNLHQHYAPAAPCLTARVILSI
ncbi:MAG: hypothetical protein Q4G66_05760 [bacterium]|nr:hypothetical protein [bacterium]